jgi:hypothetical protein
MSCVVITSLDISLFHVALNSLGDATQWWRIAQLNGLSDPDLSNLMLPVTLALPQIDTVLSSGIPADQV